MKRAENADRGSSALDPELRERISPCSPPSRGEGKRVLDLLDTDAAGPTRKHLEIARYNGP